jgi:ubiquinone/menaquinone biosynthesis C-methylase UbiE
MAWDLVADDYTAELIPHFSKYSVEALRLADLSHGARVLDVAAGPGTLSLLAAHAGAKVKALDFSPVMIDALRKRATAEGVVGIEAVVADGMRLPFAADAFAAAFSMFGLMFFPDRAQGFREIHRVLVPGGRAVVASWAPMSRVPLLAELFAAIQGALPGLPLGDAKAPLSRPEDFHEEMGAAGFTDIVVHEVTFGFEAPLAELWESMQRTNAAVVLLKKKLGEEAFRPVGEAIFEKLSARFGQGVVAVEMPANLGRGIKAVELS